MSLFFEDFAIGTKFVSAARVVTGEDIAAFSALTGDVMRIHTNDEYARQSIFGGRIAQGAFIFSVATGLFTQMNLINETLLALYAVEKLRFVKPVLPGDSVQVEKQVASLKEVDSTRGLVTFDARVFNQKAENVALYQETLLLMRRAT